VNITNNENEEILEIPSNDLVQTRSRFVRDEGSPNSLAHHVLQETNRRYHNGIACFEIECLFNDYYDENGQLVFARDFLLNHFEKYDIIIPYIMKGGRKVPLRTTADGEPKKFRVIGISYSYDGLLKQRLQVQEERYDID
jgi:hypothetical protein